MIRELSTFLTACRSLLQARLWRL